MVVVVYSTGNQCDAHSFVCRLLTPWTGSPRPTPHPQHTPSPATHPPTATSLTLSLCVSGKPYTTHSLVPGPATTNTPPSHSLTAPTEPPSLSSIGQKTTTTASSDKSPQAVPIATVTTYSTEVRGHDPRVSLAGLDEVSPLSVSEAPTSVLLPIIDQQVEPPCVYRPHAVTPGGVVVYTEVPGGKRRTGSSKINVVKSAVASSKGPSVKGAKPQVKGHAKSPLPHPWNHKVSELLQHTASQITITLQRGAKSARVRPVRERTSRYKPVPVKPPPPSPPRPSLEDQITEVSQRCPSRASTCIHIFIPPTTGELDPPQSPRAYIHPHAASLPNTPRPHHAKAAHSSSIVAQGLVRPHTTAKHTTQNVRKTYLP